MNTVIVRKLEALRHQVEAKRPLAEAHPASYAERLLDADVKFWEQVAKNLKGALGTKLAEVRVNRGGGTVWLALEGEDASDLSVSLTLGLHTTSWTDVEVWLDGETAQDGKLKKEKVPFKTSDLTPAEAAGLALKYFR